MKNTKKQIEEQKRIDYFAGLAMQSLILINKDICFEENVIEPICFTSIEFAKQMIKQLDNEQI
jgi:hypothetical protein